MLDPTRNRGPRPQAAGPVPDGTYALQIGDTLDSLAELFGVTDAPSYAAFARMNPELAAGRPVSGGLVHIPTGAATPSPPKASGASVTTAWTTGFNRSLEGQNRFNAEIESATSRWPALDPLVLKSLLAQESGFRPNATNRFGYAGIAQLGVGEAQTAGLETGRSRMRGRSRAAYVDRARDERLDPAREIPAAADVLRRKAAALEPRFATLGRPTGDDYWRFVAAAYNGGEGTVLMAMRLAYGERASAGVEWTDLVSSKDGNPRHAPLYRACAHFFGASAQAKFREISTYARDVVLRARQ